MTDVRGPDLHSEACKHDPGSKQSRQWAGRQHFLMVSTFRVLPSVPVLILSMMGCDIDI